MNYAALRSALCIGAICGLWTLSAISAARSDNATAVVSDQAATQDSKSRTQVDATPPTARIELQPKANGDGWNRTDVTVKFVCKDTGGSGVALCPLPTIIATDGVHEVSGTVVDKAGNRASVSGVVKLDRTAPALSLDTLRDGVLVYDSPVRVTGKVSDSTAGVAAVNCAETPANVAGASFACEIPVAPGAHHVRVWASDLAGNVTVARRRVVLGPGCRARTRIRPESTSISMMTGVPM